MGNTQTSTPVIRSSDVVEGNLSKLLVDLKHYRNSGIDINGFEDIIRSRFEKMPRKLCEYLFRAVTGNRQDRMNVDDFVDVLWTFQKQDLVLMARYAFAVYEIDGGQTSVSRIEKILNVVYSDEKNISSLDSVFNRDSNAIVLVDFENALSSCPQLIEWINTIFAALIRLPAANLWALERRYNFTDGYVSATSPAKRLDKRDIVTLRQTYFAAAYNASTSSSPRNDKIDMTLQAWLACTSQHICASLARPVFLHISKLMNSSWRFSDFVEFANIFASTDVQLHATILCLAAQAELLRIRGSRIKHMAITSSPVFERLDANTVVDYYDSSVLPHLIGNILPSEEQDAEPTSPMFNSSVFRSLHHIHMRRLISLLSLDYNPGRSNEESFDAVCNRDRNEQLKPSIRTALDDIEARAGLSLSVQPYVSLILANYESFPALWNFRLLACCRFGARPHSAAHEKELLIQNFVRRYSSIEHNSLQPYGPPGTQWCVISKQWYASWQFYVGISRNIEPGIEGPQEPGPIDNTSIINISCGSQREFDLRLQPKMSAAVEIIPPEAFDALQRWYGGGPRIARSVVLSDAKEGAAVVELYLLELILYIMDENGKPSAVPVKEQFSRNCTVAAVAEELWKRYGVGGDEETELGDETRSRLWSYPIEKQLEGQRLLDHSVTLGRAVAMSGPCVLLEVRGANGNWILQHGDADPKSPLKQTMTRTNSDSLSADSSSPSSSLVHPHHHQVGLENLGNTCYMNSILQSLAHLEQIVEYFRSKSHLRDLNKASKHGYGGKLALSFADCLELLLTTRKKSVTPKKFYTELTSLASQFRDQGQHDAQEFLAFLLDGISEDLNCIKEKAYVEHPDSDGRPDTLLADIWWQNHLKRDNSIIQALFTGQFKSLMKCRCGYTSARFEPFNILSLPLPEESERVATFYVALCATPGAVKVSIKYQPYDTLQHALNALGFHGEFVAVDVRNSKAKTLFSLERKLSSITEVENLFLYEVESMRGSIPGTKELVNQKEEEEEEEEDTESERKGHSIFFVHRRVRYCQGGGMRLFRMDAFGLPFSHRVLKSSGGITGRQLHDIVSARMAIAMKDSVHRFRTFEERRKKLNADLVSANGSNSPNISSTLKIDENTDSNICFPPIPNARSHTVGGAVDIETVLGGPLPERGFVLRVITGGDGRSSDACAYCPWLNACQGCLIPDKDLVIKIRDCESIAIDWHTVAYEELLDVAMMSEIRDATVPGSPIAGDIVSAGSAKRSASIPIDRCLAKFTEEEKLEGIVCPRCKADDALSKQLTLWRTPPVLFVQLKRFQFDRQHRKKLTNPVDFPIFGFDLRPFFASSKFPEATAEGSSDAMNSSTTYDLVSVIHHLGALGGGHYVATVRKGDSCCNSSSPLTSSDTTQAGEWVCFNDGSMSTVRDDDVSGTPSAYVLVYERRDVVGAPLSSLFSPPPPSPSPSPPRATAPNKPVVISDVDRPADSSDADEGERREESHGCTMH